ncbi:MAG TPA: hypothetical protein VMU89_10230 [Thermomicrobiaceae bacterium]|nr:hypothetical protein [Thermomicrobiaceae bacterium]
MASTRGSIDLTGLAEEIRRGVSATALGMSEAAFQRLSDNIARAILRAVSEGQSQSPDFGEEDRGS